MSTTAVRSTQPDGTERVTVNAAEGTYSYGGKITRRPFALVYMLDGTGLVASAHNSRNAAAATKRNLTNDTRAHDFRTVEITTA